MTPEIEKLMSRLQSFPGTRLRRRQAELDAVRKLESDFGVQLPEAHKALLRVSDGGGVDGGGDDEDDLDEGWTNLNLESVNGMSALNSDEVFRKHIPGFFIFGDDGGGYLFVYDVKNEVGRGHYAVYMVSMGGLTVDGSYFVAESFEEAVLAVMAGGYFTGGETVGQQRRGLS